MSYAFPDCASKSWGLPYLRHGIGAANGKEFRRRRGGRIKGYEPSFLDWAHFNSSGRLSCALSNPAIWLCSSGFSHTRSSLERMAFFCEGVEFNPHSTFEHVYAD